MNTSILDKLQDVCRTLNECDVEYLTIGGAAVAMHGYVRLSRDSAGQETQVDDLDFWYNPTYKNYFNLLNALEKFGEEVGRYRKEQTPDPKQSFFRVERSEYTLDFLPNVPGLPRFRDVATAKETTKLHEVEIPFISYDDLIKNKQALGRAKDQEDIRELEAKRQTQKPRERRPRQRPG